MLPLTACTGDSDDPPPSDGPESVALELSMGPGADGLTTEARDDLQNDVGAVLTTYVVEGFLGDYPRDDFVDVLDLFTSDGGQDGAPQDIDVITGAGFEDADEVVATRLEASIATFAPGREAVGVSAHVDFAFDVTEGGTHREVTLRGRLMLMPGDGDWKVFGYAARHRRPDLRRPCHEEASTRLAALAVAGPCCCSCRTRRPLRPLFSLVAGRGVDQRWTSGTTTSWSCWPLGSRTSRGQRRRHRADRA